jgi:hypothetical protein
MQSSLSQNIITKMKVENMNDLEKYKTIQRRTKLLYGVTDVQRMIRKSDVSVHFY